VASAFARHFGERAFALPALTASEDVSVIPDALGAPLAYWGIGGIDRETWRAAEAAGRLATDIPGNHSPRFAPVIQPTLQAGTAAVIVAALEWLATTREESPQEDEP
jgi:hippurate hydrolase